MKKEKKKGKATIIMLLSICIIGLLYCALHKNERNAELQQEIAEEIIRFHVIANSDAEVDQEVKLAVKDEVVSYMQKKLKHTESKREAKNIMKAEMPAIKKIAQKTIKKEGYHYSCDVVYHNRDFPIKVYGDLTFPAGKYEALDVVLGNAAGKNWWCVMFPSLCFIDGTYSVVPEESKDRLKEVLTEKEYEAIAHTEGIEVEYAFKIADWWKDVKEAAQKIVDTIW